MSQKFYWKVVEAVGRKYTSLYLKGRIEYFKDKRTYPDEGCGPLTILKTLKAARRLKVQCMTPSRPTIIKVRAKLSRQRSVWCLCDRITIRELERINPDLLLPGHSKLAEWVEFVEEVKR